MSFNEALRKLRELVGESQQVFSNRIGISVRGLANYESERTPDVVVLGRLQKIALDFNAPANVRDAIGKQFRQERDKTLKSHGGVVTFGFRGGDHAGGLIFETIEDSTEYSCAFAFQRLLSLHRNGKPEATAALTKFFELAAPHLESEDLRWLVTADAEYKARVRK